MEKFRVKSAVDDVALEFCDYDGDYFRVTIVSRDHSATCRVYAPAETHRIAGMFAEAARDWKGWAGEKEWCSMEDEFAMKLSTDRMGHVTLRLRIERNDGGPHAWLLETGLSLEAGQLEALARDAERFWSQAG